MQNSDWLKIKKVFHTALDLSAVEREAFLAKQEDGMRAEVLELLSAHESSQDFIAEPASVQLGFNGHSLIGQKIGTYKLLEILGSGGMGTVFLAEKEGLEKKFAVKLIKRGMDTEEVLRRFNLEKQILAKLSHPNIAPLLDGGMTADGLPFLVMEYVEGVPITEFCDSNKLGVRSRLEIFRNVCDAVNFAHQNLIIHRDLKPSNILVAKDRTPKLLDFGIAKILDPDADEYTETTMQHRRFTPEYASPEQISGGSITTASDVYSLGVVLYQLLSGQRPFQTESRNNLEVSNLILTTEPVKPSAAISNSTARNRSKNTKEKIQENTNSSSSPNLITPKIPFNSSHIKGDLDNIILKALRKEPARRYNSVREFSEDIRRHLKGLTVTASPDTNLYRLSKFVQRHKKSVVAGALVSLLIISFGTYAVWQGIIAERERQKAEKRLSEIREVAKSLMNETNESLGKIPGNIPMRKALTEKSVVLLDSLAKDETKDQTLLGELADAYVKLAAFQSLSFREFDKAYSNLEKAEAIYRKILLNDPDNIKVRRSMYKTHMRQAETVGERNDREKLFSFTDKVIENLREMIRIKPEKSSYKADLASIYVFFGKKYLESGNREKSVEYFDQAVKKIEEALQQQLQKDNSAKSKAEVARISFIKGWLLSEIGENQKAIKNYGSAAEFAEQVYRQDSTSVENFPRIFDSYARIGDIYALEKSYDKALDNYSEALKWINIGLKDRRLSDSDSIRMYHCLFVVKSAELTAKNGNRSKAFNLIGEGESVCLNNLKKNPNQTQLLIYQLPAFYGISDFYDKNERTEKSISLLNSLAEKMEKVRKNNVWDFGNAFALAETLEKIGDYTKGKESQRYYKKAYEIWAEYNANYNLRLNETEKMEKVKSKIT